MDVLYMAVSFILHWAFAFAFMYLCDTVDVSSWCHGESIDVKMPSVYDLDSTNDADEVNEYVKNVITPAYHYFILRRDLDKNDGCSNYFIAGVMQLVTLFLAGSNVKKVFSQGDLSDVMYKALIFLGTLGVASIGAYILYKHYKNKFALRKFYRDKNSVIENIKSREPRYNISEENDINNNIIILHYNYLLSIEKPLRQRQIIMRAVTGIFGTIIVFFVASA